MIQQLLTVFIAVIVLFVVMGLVLHLAGWKKKKASGCCGGGHCGSEGDGNGDGECCGGKNHAH